MSLPVSALTPRWLPRSRPPAACCRTWGTLSSAPRSTWVVQQFYRQRPTCSSWALASPPACYGRPPARAPGPPTLDPVIYPVPRAAKDLPPARFIAATNAANVARRKLAAFYSRYDIWLSPTTSRVAEPWGRY